MSQQNLICGSGEGRSCFRAVVRSLWRKEGGKEGAKEGVRWRRRSSLLSWASHKQVKSESKGRASLFPPPRRRQFHYYLLQINSSQVKAGSEPGEETPVLGSVFSGTLIPLSPVQVHNIPISADVHTTCSLFFCATTRAISSPTGAHPSCSCCLQQPACIAFRRDSRVSSSKAPGKSMTMTTSPIPLIGRSRLTPVSLIETMASLLPKCPLLLSSSPSLKWLRPLRSLVS